MNEAQINVKNMHIGMLADDLSQVFNFNAKYLKIRISPIRYVEDKIHSYVITVSGSTYSQDNEILDWLSETFNDDDYSIYGFDICFKHEKHAQWFIMRWSA